VSSPRRLVWWVALASVGVGMTVWLPARSLSVFLPASVSCDFLTGTVWHGGCENFSVRGSRSGDLAWTVEPMDFDGVAVPLRFLWQRENSHLQGTLRGIRKRELVLEDIEGEVSLQTLRDSLPADMTLGPLAAVAGRLRFFDLDLALDAQGELRAGGTVELRDTVRLRDRALLGDFRASFGDGASKQPSGELQSVSGPLGVDGIVEFSAGRRYAVTLRLAPRDVTAARALGVLTATEVSAEGNF